jgi:dTDP-glucose 4,6-dehydratase
MDIDSILASRHPRWQSLMHANILITGGTGFIGRWLLESLAEANHRHCFNLHITLITRNPEIFKNHAPHLAQAGNIHIQQCDLVNAPHITGNYSHIIHAAADSSSKLNEEQPLSVFHSILRGTESILELASTLPSTKVLFLSSGAVYGQQPPELAGVPETWNGSPNPQVAKNTYGEAKRAAEMLCAIYRKQFGVNVVSARIFSLLGPFLPLGTHFAAGNFIRDALAGNKIVVQGNGRPVRSYLYPSDLIIWLLTLLTASPREPAYNIGSERAVSIAELAQTVAALIGRQGYEVLGRDDTGWNAGRYVPDTSLIRSEFSLAESVSLESAILNTAAASLSN